MKRDTKTNTSISNVQPQLTLKELRHVWLLHRSLSFKQAAANAGISQSALSQSIANIEQRLRITLFNRNQRNVHPTPYGRMVANQAESVLHIMEDLHTHIDAMRETREGLAAFGMGIFAANHLLNPVLATYHNRFPNVQLHTSIAPVRDLQSQLARGEIQFFVAGRDPQFHDKEATREFLYREVLVAACRPGHPLLSGSSIPSVELIRYPAITYDGGYLRRQIYPQLNNSEEFELLERNCPSIELQQPWLLIDFVKNSDYLLIASRTALRDWLLGGELATVDVTDLDLTIDIELTQRRDNSLTPANQEMVEVIKQVMHSQHLA